MEFLKRNKKFVAIMAGGLAVVVAIVGTCIAKNKNKEKPEDVLKQSVTKLKEDIKNSESPLEKEIKIKELLSYGKDNPTSVNMDIKANIPFVSVPIGLKAEANTDPVKKDNFFKLDLNINDISLLNIQETKVGNELFLSVPDYLKDTYKVNLDSVLSDFQTSAWKDMLGLTGEFSLNEINVQKDEYANYVKNFQNDFSKVWDNHKDTLKSTITYRMDKTAVYVIINKDEANSFISELKDTVIESDALNELLKKMEDSQSISDYNFMNEDDFSDLYETEDTEASESGDKSQEDILNKLNDLLDIHLTEDLTIRFDMDNSRNITAIKIVSGNTPDSEYITEFGFEINFKGEDTPASDMAAQWYVYAADDAELYGSFDQSYGYDEEGYWKNADYSMGMIDGDGESTSINISTDFAIDNKNKEFTASFSGETEDSDFYLEAEGTIDDFTPGENIKVTFGDVYVESNGDKLMELSGTFEVKPLDKEIAKPENAINLLNMSAEEIQQMISELQENLSKIIPMSSDDSEYEYMDGIEYGTNDELGEW